jgi:hypothetical protein
MVPPVNEPVAVIAGMDASAWEANCPANATTYGVAGPGPPVTVTSPVRMFDRATSAVCTTDEIAL